jgi:iron complex outermembrane receptor protein
MTMNRGKVVCAIGAGVLAGALSFAIHARASEDGGDSVNLADLSLEELLDVDVYSVAKKKQKLSESAAAVYVLTQEDIRRSGATSIPEALRLVPGVEVARIDANKWAISVRGFNDRFANKLLVLIDGRSVYTPLFAGTYWDMQDTLLEDIDRIEVVRGPGGTLWGANAVNGVINIITKSAADTQGAFAEGGGGSEERGFGAARYGAKIGENAYLRVYGKYFDRDDSEGLGGRDTHDHWNQGRGGFRADWKMSEDDNLTVQGDVYDGVSNAVATVPVIPQPLVVGGPFTDTFPEPTDVFGANVLGRWKHKLAEGSDTELQIYYDRTERSTPTFSEDRDTLDIDFQHNLSVGDNQALIWGLGYRFSYDDIGSNFNLFFSPDHRGLHLFSGFLQDEISLFDDRLRLTLGTKLEHNDFTGFEFQPSGRFLWKPKPRHAIWGAISRAVRTPSRAEDDIQIRSRVDVVPVDLGPPVGVTPIPFITTLNGSRSYKSEQLLAFELGYRVQPIDNASLDIAAFYNIYDDLRSISPRRGVLPDGTPIPEPGLTGTPPNLTGEVAYDIGNYLEGDTYGLEVAGDWHPLEAWKLRAGYSFLEVQLDAKGPAVNDPVSLAAEGSSPRHQFFLRSLADLPCNLQLDANFRWVDRLPAQGVDSYGTLDVRLAWLPTDQLEISVVGQGLLDRAHREFGASNLVFTDATKVEQGVYGKIVWRY